MDSSFYTFYVGYWPFCVIFFNSISYLFTLTHTFTYNSKRGLNLC